MADGNSQLLNDFVRIQGEFQAQAGHGILTPAQEQRLTTEQTICQHKIDGKTYLFAVSAAASQRLFALAKKELRPPAIAFNPFTLATAFRAIEFIDDVEYLTLVRVIQDAVMGPIEMAEVLKSKPDEELTKKELCDIFLQKAAEVLTPSELPTVDGPAATRYQRAANLATTVNLKMKFNAHCSLRKMMKKSEIEIAKRMQSSPGGGSSSRAAPYAPAPQCQPSPKGKGGGKQQLPKGGGKGGGGKKGGGSPKGGPATPTCLEWIKGTCPGTDQASCPNNHLHHGPLSRLDWLSSRFVLGMTSEQLAAKASNSEAEG
eukprot:g19039.t1